MRENGGSRMTLCEEKMHRSRSSLTRCSSGLRAEKALQSLRRDSFEHRARIAPGACRRQRRSSMSVANTCTLGGSASRCALAAAWPTNTPLLPWRIPGPTHARCPVACVLEQPRNHLGRDRSERFSVPEKLVTPISRSRNSSPPRLHPVPEGPRNPERARVGAHACGAVRVA